MRSIPLSLLLLLTACGEPPPPASPPAPAVDPGITKAIAQARAMYKPLPTWMTADGVAPSTALVDLGRDLYYEPRLSKSQEISCNTCHLLDKYGVDGQPTSTGHKGQHGNRSAPTTYNAALHIAQFWDGRAADVEAQAKGPVTNPIEMAMPAEPVVVATLASIPGYAPKFQAAFPEDAEPISFDHMATAIGAFERGLVTPAPWDAFLAGDDGALSPAQLAGLQTFLDTGCQACHSGVAMGGGGYFKLGTVVPYETADVGREQVTGSEADRYFFKVPSLRNITATGPYFHDGSIQTLDEAVRLMAHHQLGKDLSPEEVGRIVSFLGALKGEPVAAYIAKPALMEAGPKTPGPAMD